MDDTARLPSPGGESLPDLLERLWDQGQRPDVHRLLQAVGPRPLTEVVRALSIDQWRRWQAGERVHAEDYLRAYPALQAEADCALELIYGELLVREQLGESPDEGEYLRRFPDLAERLGHQFELYRAFRSQADPTGPDAPTLRRGPLDGPAPHARKLPRVPGYEILAELGRGGMGVVYKARDTRLNRTVALKMVLGGGFARPEDLVRFLVEAEMAARVRHPNVVQIYEVGTHDGLPYFVLEYVEGGNLAQRLDGRPWPPRVAAALVEALARAIHAAHLQGIVHRDLKPANVLLQSNSTTDHTDGTDKDKKNSFPSVVSVPSVVDCFPKIADFGLAKQLENSSDLTRSGVIVGTPGYMSPEQAAARRGEVGPPTDVWALGAILYELLAGKLPFRGEAVEILQKVMTEDVPALSGVRPAVPRDLRTVCLKCLAKDPRKRYASAEALAEDLRRFRAGEPVTARPVGAAERAWLWARRNPAWAATLTVVAALLLVVAVGASLMIVRLNTALEVSEAERIRAEGAEQSGRHRLWQAYLAQARASRLSGRPGQLGESVQALRKALELPVPPGHSRAELRDEAAACLVLPDLVPVREWPGWSSGTVGIEFDADFRRYAHVDRDGNITVRDLSDNAEIARLPGKGPAFAGPALSPDGRFLQTRYGDGLVTVWRLDRPRPVAVLKDVPTGRSECNVAFSRDSRRAAIYRADGSVGVYSLVTGRELRRLRPDLVAWRLAFHPSGRRIAVAGGTTVRVLDLDGWAVAELTHPAEVYGIAWHPDGKTLAAGSHDYQIRLWDVERGSLTVPPLIGHRHMGLVVAFTADGERVVSSDWGGFLHLWDAGTGRHLMALPNGGFSSGPAACKLVVQAVGNSVRLLRPDAGRGLRVFAPRDASEGQSYYNALGSPDGRYLVAGTANRLAILDWASGAELASLPLRSARALAFEPGPNPALLTYNPRAVLRWPVREGAGGAVSVGPAENLYTMTADDHAAFAVTSRTVVAAQWRQALVLHRPRRRVVLGPLVDTRHCAISPDERYVATNNWSNARGDSVTVWDAQTGKPLHRLRLGGNTGVAFSPGGRWLLTSGGGIRLWRVGTWAEGPRLPTLPWAGAAACLTADDRLLALTGEVSQLLLIEADTGRVVGRLAVPEQTPLVPQCFSPDGTRLVALGEQNRVLYSWDLRELRAQLKGLDLDWDWPEFGPAAPQPPRPAAVRVDAGLFFAPANSEQAVTAYSIASVLLPWHPEAHFRRGAALYRLGRYREAVRALDEAIALDPRRALAYRLRGQAHVKLEAPSKAVPDFGAAIRLEPERVDNYALRADAALRAWNPRQAVADYRKLVAMQPDNAVWNASLARLLALMPPPLRDPQKALPLATRAMELEPTAPHRHTLGVVLYRLKRFREARACFAENLKADHDQAGFDLYGLAACQQQLGEPQQARATFERAVAWRRAHPKLPQDQRYLLGAYESEVRTTLGPPAGK